MRIGTGARIGTGVRIDTGVRIGTGARISRLIITTALLVACGCGGRRVALPSPETTLKALATIDLAANAVAVQVATLEATEVLTHAQAQPILEYCGSVQEAVRAARAIQAGELSADEKRVAVAKIMLAVRVPEHLTAVLTGTDGSAVAASIRVAVESIRLMVAIWGGE